MLANIREEFTKGKLHRSDLAKDPIAQFNKWMNEALQAECLHPTAMALATVDADQRPNNRIVLLKEVNEQGFVFFTNYESRKGSELKEQPYACINFFWGELERQVRISGKVKKVSDEQSDAYFQSRPRESRLGALASPQSQKIENGDSLLQNYQNLKTKFEGKTIPRPAHWGGYVLTPDAIEFWQGRASRMHDRFLYSLENNEWTIDRLGP